MAESLPSEGGGEEGAFPPSGNPPSIVDVLGGELGLLEHILLFLVKEDDTSAERVVAGTTAVRWLNVCTQTKQLVGPALWNTLLSTYFPNYPLPIFGFISVRTLFREMWSRHNEYAKAWDLHMRLCLDEVWADTASKRTKWEIGQSKLAAKSDLEWRASFLKTWDGALKTVPIHQQNAERFS